MTLFYESQDLVDKGRTLSVASCFVVDFENLAEIRIYELFSLDL